MPSISDRTEEEQNDRRRADGRQTIGELRRVTNNTQENVMALTAKQERFVEEYLIDLNATQAAVRAGYSENTARQTGTENLSKPYIAEVIEAAITERSERTELTQDMVINELRKSASRIFEKSSRGASDQFSKTSTGMMT
jgi:hypothetical protein